VFSPVEIHVEEKKRMVFCDCKQTNNLPFCNGSLSQIHGLRKNYWDRRHSTAWTA